MNAKAQLEKIRHEKLKNLTQMVKVGIKWSFEKQRELFEDTPHNKAIYEEVRKKATF